MRGIRATLLGGALTLVIGAFVGPQQALASSTPFPNTIASAGDSITRAFDVNFACVLQDCPQYSWSTGITSNVQSHYTRLLALNPGISGRGVNLAKSGAKVADLLGQLQVAGQFKAAYVTVLIGANDLCTSSAATMTPAQTFLIQFYAAISQYFSFNPGGHVFVSSIPDLLSLWTTLHNNPTAVTIWSAFGICQSMLSTSNTDADRQVVVHQEATFNSILATVCAHFPNCRWDGYAVNKSVFTAVDISTVDFFHPSVQGQAALAAVTWTASFWGT